MIAFVDETKSINENPLDGAVSHDFEFKISDASGIQRSELDIKAY